LIWFLEKASVRRSAFFLNPEMMSSNCCIRYVFFSAVDSPKVTDFLSPIRVNIFVKNWVSGKLLIILSSFSWIDDINSYFTSLLWATKIKSDSKYTIPGFTLWFQNTLITSSDMNCLFDSTTLTSGNCFYNSKSRELRNTMSRLLLFASVTSEYDALAFSILAKSGCEGSVCLRRSFRSKTYFGNR
jgi:hypothetical protein